VGPAELRAAFPVLERLAYLNAGTCGPVPQTSVDAAAAVLRSAAEDGRWMPHFERMMAAHERLRAAYAERIGAQPGEVALTTSTSEGVGRVLSGLNLKSKDRVVTSDEEHPGVLGPLAAAQRRLGIDVVEVPLRSVAEAADGAALVACSHVGWVSGAVAPPELAELDVPVLLDGAQGAGAITVDVAALGCDFYAAAGQKWLCGPIGTGLLYVAPAWQGRLEPVGPTYINLEQPNSGLAARPWPDARAHDASALSVEACAAALAAHDDVLGAFGWPALHERATGLAAQLADALAERGHTVAPRGDTTLVSWECADTAAVKTRLAGNGIVVRDLPGRPLLRASVGAWNDEDDLERLLSAL
jgi:L-cysteine/cystine lyase